MTWLLIGLGVVLTLIFVSVRWGASRQKAKDTERSLEKAKDMLEAEANAPRTKGDVLDRLDRDRF